jgi:hypothetical protein
MVELLQGLIQDDQRREREEPNVPQLATFRRPAVERTENGG